MGLRAPTSTQSNRTPQAALEPGSYPGRIVRIIDEGLQPQIDFTTKEPKKPAYVIRVTYELVDAFMLDEDGNELEDKPRWVSENFKLLPLSSDLAISTKRSKAIDPANKLEGDWSQYLNAPCSVVIGNYEDKKGNTRDKVLNVTAMRPRDAANLTELKNEAKFFDLGDPDLEFFNSMPKWQQEVITSNLEFAGSPLERALKGGKPVEPKKAPEPEPHEDEGTDDETPW